MYCFPGVYYLYKKEILPKYRGIQEEYTGEVSKRDREGEERKDLQYIQGLLNTYHCEEERGE